MRFDLRVELIEIDSTRPVMGPLEPMRVQLLCQRRGRRERPLGGTVEAPHDFPDPFGRDAGTDRNIIRKAGVEGGGEVAAAPEAPSTRRPADRPFGRNVDAVGTLA